MLAYSSVDSHVQQGATAVSDGARRSFPQTSMDLLPQRVGVFRGSTRPWRRVPLPAPPRRCGARASHIHGRWQRLAAASLSAGVAAHTISAQASLDAASNGPAPVGSVAITDGTVGTFSEPAVVEKLHEQKVNHHSMGCPPQSRAVGNRPWAAAMAAAASAPPPSPPARKLGGSQTHPRGKKRPAPRRGRRT